MNYLQGKLSSAIQQFREAIQEDFSYLEPLYNLSLIYRRQQLYDAELESLNLLVTVSKILPVLWYFKLKRTCKMNQLEV